MNPGKTLFAQLMDFLPVYEFRKCVERYHGHYKVQSFSCWDHFLCLAFAQLTYRESLRDIEACLRSVQPKLYHLGIRGQVSRNTLANANGVRDWRIYADFAQVLISQARLLYAHEDFGLELDQTVVKRHEKTGQFATRKIDHPCPQKIPFCRFLTPCPDIPISHFNL